MKNRSIQNHVPLLILAAAAVIVVGALLGFMHYQISSLLAQTVSAQSAIGEKQADQGRDQDLISLYGDTAADRAQMTGIFIPSDDIVDFIEAVEAIGPEAAAKISLSSINADSLDGAPAGTLGTVDADVSVSGSWPAVMQALMLSEALPYDVTIDAVRLDASIALPSAHGQRDSWSLSYNIRAEIIASSTTAD